MKGIKISATLMLLGTLMSGMAQSSVDAQIEAIKNTTSEQERVKLMNEFKTTLTTLSQEEIDVAVDKLMLSLDQQSKAQGMEVASKYQMKNQTQVGSESFMLKNSGTSSNICESGDFKYQRAK
ncbi:MAG: hypothetical protein QG559_423 [Campylobacterota bacterium]|nr:hypothetical protein [Campylobacterota bacterium]